LTEDLYVTVPRGQYKKLDASMTIKAKIIAPAIKGQELGRVEVKLGEVSFAERELVALEAVQSGSIWNNLVDEVKLMFE
jgi:D-alanyl-D-alanine carboxypeptidase (penicillin-binding protein 5/6)